MWRKRDFKETSGLFSSKKKEFETYTRNHPRKVIAAMFLILLVAVTTLLISRLFNRKSYAASIGRFYSEMDSNSQKTQLGKKSNTDGLIELYQLNGKLKQINPDSITAKDSLLLLEIETDLNNIIDEKN